ncbi:MAG: dihydroorotate dehydrogenase electron transfer subunit [Erysipelotrichales bacterium]|nr:MAG: dihydroorotate dehydrogenase electron transfer subunit [Erysipelotrichales bacterium]
MIQEKQTLLSNVEIAPNIYELTLSGDMIDVMIPGQFVHIQVPQADLLLRRPISIAKFDLEKKCYTVLIRAEGEGTKAICATCAGGLLDVLGSLGNGFETDFLQATSKVLLIGGGIGVPPLLGLAHALQKRQLEIHVILGFHTKSAVVYEEDFNACGKTIVTTDDGSHGLFGDVSTAYDLISKDISFDAIYACGPKGLNRWINRRFADHPHAYISLEERMGCGIGACAACVCPKQNGEGNIKICQHGPVFKTGEVIV